MKTRSEHVTDFAGVQFRCSVMSNYSQPHGLQHTRVPCPSSTPGACSSSCPSSQWCNPTISSSVVPFSLLPSIFASIRVFSNESVLCIKCSKYWSFSFNISPSNEYLGLISFRMDCLDLLAVQGTLKSILQHHTSKALILWHSAFFIVQLPHSYMTTGKSVALTRWTFVDKVLSLLFNVLSRLVIAFLPRSKCLLISWQQSPSAVILEPQKIKSAQASSIVHRTWTGNSFHIWYFTCFNAILPNLSTLSLSHKVHKTVLYISVSFNNNPVYETAKETLLFF